MTPFDPTVRVVDAVGEEGLGRARRLFRAYAAEYAASIAESLCVRGFEAELADTLPEMAGALGPYRSFGFVGTTPYWDCPVERTAFLERRLSA